MLLRAVLVYKMCQVSFPRDVYRRSGALLKWGSDKSNLRSDPRCYLLITEQPVTKVCLLNTSTYCLSSHQEHRFVAWRNLLANPLGHALYFDRSIWFFAYKPEQDWGSVHFRGYCEPHIRWMGCRFKETVLFNFSICRSDGRRKNVKNQN